MAEMYESILYQADGPIATIKLNRPQKLNAFGGSMREDVLDALQKAGDDQAVPQGPDIAVGEQDYEVSKLRRLRKPNRRRFEDLFRELQ